jgi:peptidoglycan/xylan/chitin deacetylase (PgdA/CDA1 family)
MLDIANTLRSVLSRSARPVLASIWLVTHRDFLLVFNWHQVTPSFDPGLHHRYTWTALHTFRATINFLTAHFQIVPLQSALERAGAGNFGGRCVALTFDDGDASIAEYVAPLLKQRNLPATFFVNTAYLGGGCAYWFTVLSYAGAALPEGLRQRALGLRNTGDSVFYDDIRRDVEQLSGAVPQLNSRLVSAEWLAKLDADQFTIGAHGHEHQRYSMMSQEWQRQDLKRNVEILSQFRAYRPLFAVPFGRAHDWNSATLEVARELGLVLLLADGGINLTPLPYYRRQPADSLSATKMVVRALMRPD